MTAKDFLHQIRNRWLSLTDLPSALVAPLVIGVTSLVVTGLLVTVRQGGGLQKWELQAYDQMVRLRSDAASDSRLLIVAITEADIKAEKRWPLSDRTVALALQQLEKHQPQVIGLDLYRDIPHEPGHQQLLAQLAQPNLIAITKLPDSEDLGVAPPPRVPPERVGFNDITSDADGVVRRGLLFASTETETFYSFALQLSLRYLQARGITPRAGQQNPENLQLGNVEFLPLEKDSGQYKTLDDRGYQFLLNYRSRRNLARQISLNDVLQGKFDPAWVRGKIVLIGTTARSAKDVFLTPYSAAEREIAAMPGVVLHAQAVSQILSAVLDNQPLISFCAEWVDIAWIACWVLVGAWVAWFFRHPLAFGLVNAIAIAVLLGTCFGFFLLYTWVPVIAPTLGLVITAIAVVAYRAQRAYRQQQMMMKLLGQNTSPEIARALWKSRDRLLKSGKLPGQRLVATMLFTDIRNFSTISEQMPPENLLEWLNEYLSAITQEVRANQGIINKFTGDGMMAVFGVPMNRTSPIDIAEDAQQAVNCALAMGERLSQLNQDWQTRQLPVIQMRVGIFTGPVVVGSLGGKDRLEYGVIGDSVNIASRLESYEKDRQSEVCRILIAKDTLVHLQGKFEVEHWGPLLLKGKHQAVDIYRVLGRAPSRDGQSLEPA